MYLGSVNFVPSMILMVTTGSDPRCSGVGLRRNLEVIDVFTLVEYGMRYDDTDYNKSNRIKVRFMQPVFKDMQLFLDGRLESEDRLGASCSIASAGNSWNTFATPPKSTPVSYFYTS